MSCSGFFDFFENDDWAVTQAGQPRLHHCIGPMCPIGPISKRKQPGCFEQPGCV